MLKVGIIDFINVFPLTHQLVNQNEYFDFTLDSPKTLSDLLLKNELDLSQISSSFYLQHKDQLELIKEFGISATNFVKSVHLYHNSPLEDIKTIYITPQSYASFDLLRVLAMHHWFIECEFKVIEDFQELIEKPAFLLIGNMALMKPHFEGYETIDLAKSWYEMTQLPFVFGVHCAQKNLSSDKQKLVQQFLIALKTSYEWGLSNPDEIIKAARKIIPIPTPILVDYFDHLQFELTQDHLESLKVFDQYLKACQKPTLTL